MNRAAKLPRSTAVRASPITIEQLTESVGDEWMEWYRMTPAERWRASGIGIVAPWDANMKQAVDGNAHHEGTP